jgi:riboflavin kinase/FMN adenylyltransferase
LLVEAHLIDFDGDLYGHTLRIAFISRLRGERRFASVEELVAQMERDVEVARDLCASFTPP